METIWANLSITLTHDGDAAAAIDALQAALDGLNATDRITGTQIVVRTVEVEDWDVEG